MAQQFVNSSNLSWVDYDLKEKLLKIGFKRGDVYEYYDVPAYVFANLLMAPSMGAYFRDTIYYGYERNLLGQFRARGKGTTYDEVSRS